MDSEDDCSLHFFFLDVNFDSFFMIFQKKKFTFKFQKFFFIKNLKSPLHWWGKFRLTPAVADVVFTPFFLLSVFKLLKLTFFGYFKKFSLN